MEWTECFKSSAKDNSSTHDFNELSAPTVVTINNSSYTQTSVKVTRKGKVRRKSRVLFTRDDVKVPRSINGEEFIIVIPDNSVLVHQWDYIESLVTMGNGDESEEKADESNTDGKNLKKRKIAATSETTATPTTDSESDSKSVKPVRLLLCCSELNELIMSSSTGTHNRKTANLYAKYRKLAANHPEKVLVFPNQFCAELKNQTQSQVNCISEVGKWYKFNKASKTDNNANSSEVSETQSNGAGNSKSLSDSVYCLTQNLKKQKHISNESTTDSDSEIFLTPDEFSKKFSSLGCSDKVASVPVDEEDDDDTIMLSSDKDLKKSLADLRSKTSSTVTDTAVTSGNDYPLHLSESALQTGLNAGKYQKGTIRMRPNTCNYATVNCYNYVSNSKTGAALTVEIEGKYRINRACEGDVVVVEILDNSENTKADKKLNIADEDEDDEEHDSKKKQDVTGSMIAQEGIDDEGDDRMNKILNENNDGEKENKSANLTNKTASSSEPQTKSGKVVGILRRNWRELAGTLRPLQDIDGNDILNDTTDNLASSRTDRLDRIFIPIDPKYPLIRIPTRESSLLEKKRILVKIDSWPSHSKYPNGHWTKILGDLHDRKTESEVILHEHGVNTKPFTDEAYSCLPSGDFYTEGIPSDMVPRPMQPKDDDTKASTSLKHLNTNGTNGSINSEGLSPKDHSIIHSMSKRVCQKLNAKKVPFGQLSQAGCRVDLTDIENLSSVDPPGCKDIDDALSCEGPFEYEVDCGGAKSEKSKKFKKYFRVGVHIADVTFFLKSDTSLDKEAQNRCTTVYLVERRTDMLPSLLTTDLCSLVGNQPRLSFSVFWDLDSETGEIIRNRKNGPKNGVEFCKGVILSRAALSYQQAQTRIDNHNKSPSDPNHDPRPLTKSLNNLNNLAKLIRNKRKQNGALELASQEMKFELNENQDPTSVKEYTLYDTNRMVEEMMLLANCTVAEQILETYPLNGVLRRHPTPKMDALEALGKIVEEKIGSKNLLFKYDSNKALADTLDRLTKIGNGKKVEGAVDDVNDDQSGNLNKSKSKKRKREQAEDNDSNNKQIVTAPPQKSSTQILTQLIKMMTTRCMNQATYFTTGDIADQSQFQHYGLAMSLYTHFTSPIRRYADVLVHRLLMHSLGLEDVGVESVWGGRGMYGGPQMRGIEDDKTSDESELNTNTIINDDDQTHTVKSTSISLLPPQLSSRDRLREQCDRINYRHKMAQWCSRASGDFHTYLYFYNLPGKSVEGVEGIITRIKKNAGSEGSSSSNSNGVTVTVSVNIPRYGIEGQVRISANEKNSNDSNTSSNVQVDVNDLKVFDRILLKIEASDKDFRNRTTLTYQGKIKE